MKELKPRVNSHRKKKIKARNKTITFWPITKQFMFILFNALAFAALEYTTQFFSAAFLELSSIANKRNAFDLLDLLSGLQILVTSLLIPTLSLLVCNVILAIRAKIITTPTHRVSKDKQQFRTFIPYSSAELSSDTEPSPLSVLRPMSASYMASVPARNGQHSAASPQLSPSTRTDKVTSGEASSKEDKATLPNELTLSVMARAGFDRTSSDDSDTVSDSTPRRKLLYKTT